MFTLHTIKHAQGWASFLGNDRSFTFFYSERNGTGQNGTGRNGTRTERLKKKEQERNDLDEGPCSRMERNDFKKVGTCPALSMCNFWGKKDFQMGGGEKNDFSRKYTALHCNLHWSLKIMYTEYRPFENVNLGV